MESFEGEGSRESDRPASLALSVLRGRARERDRIRFSRVLDEAADFLERHGELPDAVRWLRKEASAWRSSMRWP